MSALTILPFIAPATELTRTIVDTARGPAQRRHALAATRQQGGFELGRAAIESMPAAIEAVSNAFAERERTKQVELQTHTALANIAAEREKTWLQAEQHRNDTQALVMLHGQEPDAANRLRIIEAIGNRR